MPFKKIPVAAVWRLGRRGPAVREDIGEEIAATQAEVIRCVYDSALFKLCSIRNNFQISWHMATNT